MKLADGDRLLFIGDSITDCGRAWPVGERAGLGDGYVALVDSLLAAWYPERHVRVLNTGIGGNRVTDLRARWQSDVLDLKPDWLSVMIGINDVWRHFDSPFEPHQVAIDLYENTYHALLERTRPMLKGLVLVTPYYLESNRSDPMRRRMDQYGEVVKRLAAGLGAILVDVQAAFDRYLAHRPARSLADDGIHVDQTGHTIIARTWLTTIGFDWEQAGTHD
ncbi:MAG: SGNH/GDSL hydrolase family protein [Anaerolineae bacterium]|nr:SGNH/GDSL hydrolase family protein [Anaerolineae bacterium]